VVTGTAGSTTDDATLLSTEPLYIDFAILNNGTATTTSGFQNALYIDGVLQNTWTDSAALSPNAYYEITGFSIGTLSAGMHSLQIVADSADQILESNKNDNTYLKTITVGGQAAMFDLVAMASPAADGSAANGGEYALGATATLVATPNSGFSFSNWTENGTVVSTTARFVINPVTASGTYVANFIPTLAIASPTSASAYGTFGNAVTLAGTVASGSGISVVECTNSATGNTLVANGTTNWTITDMPLKPGANLLTVTGLNGGQPTATATLTVTVSTFAAVKGT
jgi:hypothetical protein